MYQTVFGASFGFESDVCTSALKIFAIGAGGNFPVFILAGQPDFNIIGLGSRESQITGAQGDHAVVEPQFLQDVFGMTDEEFQVLIGMVWMRDPDHFHLVKLMLADDAFGVLAVGTRLGAEAGGEGRECTGEVFFA